MELDRQAHDVAVLLAGCLEGGRSTFLFFKDNESGSGTSKLVVFLLHNLGNLNVLFVNLVELVVSDHRSTLLESENQILICVSESDIGNFNLINLIQSAKHTRSAIVVASNNAGTISAVIRQKLLNFLFELCLQTPGNRNSVVTVTALLAVVVEVPFGELVRGNGELNGVVGNSHGAHVPLQLVQLLLVVETNHEKAEQERHEDSR